MMLHRDDAFSDNYCYEQCTEDRESFYKVGAWWRGSHKKQFKNRPKPEMNKMWRAINRLIGNVNDMELNSIIIASSSDATTEGADVLQKRWRNDFQSSDGMEASENANSEAIVGGFGCVKLSARYEDEENPTEEEQYLSIDIVHDASNTVRFGVESIKKDKSDAKRAWQLISGNREAFEEQFNVDNIVSFPSQSSDSYELDYNSNKRDCYLAHYYEVVEKTLTEYDFTLVEPQLVVTTGDGIKGADGRTFTREDLARMQDIYLDSTGSEVPERRIKTKYVLHAVADGDKYLTKPQKLPFKRIPLFPRYGYYTVINGEEFFCGEVRKRVDHEMFYNYYASAMMEIMTKPQVSRPEYLPEQMARHGANRASADINNDAYVLSDPATLSDGTPVLGKIGETSVPQIGTGLVAAGNLLEQNNAQMDSSGQSTVPANTSGEAIQQVNDRSDDAFLPIVKNILHSIKAVCEGWIPGAQKLYFSNPRKLLVKDIDGAFDKVNVMEMIKTEDGEFGPFGNTANGRYLVQVEQGEAYKDQRDSERQDNLEMLQYVAGDTEFGQLIAMNAMTLTNGDGGGDMRVVARYKMLDIMLQMGIPLDLKNEKEEQYVQSKIQQMQQAQEGQQDPAMALAMAEQSKAEADMAGVQVKQEANQISAFEAETRRLEVQVKAQEAGVKIDKTVAETNKINAEASGTQIDSIKKVYGDQ